MKKDLRELPPDTFEIPPKVPLRCGGGNAVVENSFGGLLGAEYQKQTFSLQCFKQRHLKRVIEGKVLAMMEVIGDCQKGSVPPPLRLAT
jgi:hypothetical protein